MASSSAPPPPLPPPPLPPLPPLAAKKSILRRVFPLLVVANVFVGVYVFTRASKKQSSEKAPPAPVVTSEAPAPEKVITTEKVITSETTTPALKALPPIPEHEQRELFKLILEEKRKVKPKDKLEKKKLDEDKALLKNFIRAESIPSL